MLFELLPYPMDIVITFLKPSKFYITSTSRRRINDLSRTIGKVIASTMFMCVCSMFRPSDFLLNTISKKRIRGGGALPR